MKANLKRYFVVYVGVLVVVAIVTGLLRQLAAIDLATSFVPVIPAMVAAMYEGSRLAKEGADYPMGKPAWIEALRMTLVALAFNGILGFGVFVGLSGAGFRVQGLIVFLGALSMYCVFWLIANRVFLTQGYRNATANAARNTKKKDVG